jgi:iron(III) transport system substrate-binding protein
MDRRTSQPHRGCAALVALTLCAGLAATAAAQQLNVICPVQAEWCALAATEFEKETGIKVSMTLKGSGEAFAQIAAEKANPKLDVWFGGTGDPHLQAAEQGLLDEYKSPMLAQLQPWAQKQAEQSKFRTVGMYLGVLGMGYNTELLTKKKLAAPACWKDLIKPEFTGEVQMANPNASGTAYTAIATLVQVMGEEEAFKYLKSLHKNINNYPRSGVGPIKAAARGETLASVSFIHDVITEAQAGFPVGRCAVRRHRLRDRVDVDRQGRAQSRQRQEILRLKRPQGAALAAQAKQFQFHPTSARRYRRCRRTADIRPIVTISRVRPSANVNACSKSGGTRK